MQEIILEIQRHIAVYAKHARSNRDAVVALEKLKDLGEQTIELERQLAAFKAGTNE